MGKKIRFFINCNAEICMIKVGLLRNSIRYKSYPSKIEKLRTCSKITRPHLDRVNIGLEFIGQS